jgi:hypothetical protein
MTEPTALDKAKLSTMQGRKILVRAINLVDELIEEIEDAEAELRLRTNGLGEEESATVSAFCLHELLSRALQHADVTLEELETAAQPVRRQPSPYSR